MTNEEGQPIGTTRRTFLSRVGLTGLGLALGFSIKSNNESAPEQKVSAAEVTPVSEPILDISPTPIFEVTSSKDIEVFGMTNPISKDQLPDFFQQLNSEKTEIKSNTYYGNFFVFKDVYDQFPKDNDGESLESYLKRHEIVLQEMISKNDPDTKVKLQRLIILENNEQEISDQSLRAKIVDSDGEWIFRTIYNPASTSEVSPYYDKERKIDYGLLHELGHAFLHLPDQYPLDTDYSKDLENLPYYLRDLPDGWKEYFASRRPDIANDLMSGPQGYFINKYSALQLARRFQKNDVQNKSITNEGGWFFPNEIPEISHLSLGEEYSNQEVEFFRSYEVDANNRTDFYSRKKTFPKIGTYTLSNKGILTLPGKDLFTLVKNNLIPAENSVLLIKIKGKDIFRWMDVRDFNIAYWLGHKGEVNMQMKMMTAADKQYNFPWQIEYSGNIDN